MWVFLSRLRRTTLGAAAGLAAVALVAAAGSAAAQEERTGGLLETTLPSGLTVTILRQEGAPVVATEVWYHVGSADEEPGSRGLAHLFEHLMFGGTERFPRDAYGLHHERHGGYENAWTSFDETVYVSVIDPAGHDRVLEMEADRLAHLRIDEENLSNEKRIVVEELRLRERSDPEQRVMVAAQRAILGDHPYALTPAGRVEDIERASLEGCREFARRYYRPGNAHLVVVGPVDPESTLERVRELFGALPPGAPPPAEIPELLGRDYPELLVMREDLPPVEIALRGYVLPGPASEDGAAIELLLEMLGGGSVDLLENELVRRRKRAVFATTESLSFRHGGALVFAAAFLPYRRQCTARRDLQRAVERLGRFGWLDPQALDSARRRLLLGRHAAAYSPAVLADRIGRARWWLGDTRRAFTREAELRAVGTEDIERVFRTYLARAKPVEVYLRPRRVPLWIRLFGWLWPLVR